MTNRVVSRSLFLVVAMTVSLLVSSAGNLHAQAGVQKVKSIEVRGNKRIEESAIRGRLTLKVDDPYTGEAVRTQIRL
ncbi:MAG: POTRA domain-containing protein, partial [Nitrospiraceae bacterium]